MCISDFGNTHFGKFKFGNTRQKKVGRLDCRDRFYSEPTGQNCINSKERKCTSPILILKFAILKFGDDRFLNIRDS